MQLDFSRYAQDAPFATAATNSSQSSGARVAGVPGGKILPCCGFKATDAANGYKGKFQPHAGIDVHAPAGTPVYTNRIGKQVERDRSASYGHYSVIRYTVNGTEYYALYGHLSETYDQGLAELVPDGTQIGKIGADASNGDGARTDTHVHIQVATSKAGALATGMHRDVVDPAILFGTDGTGGGPKLPGAPDGMTPAGISQGIGVGVANGAMWALKKVYAYTILRPLDYAGGFTFEFTRLVLDDFDPGGLFPRIEAAYRAKGAARESALEEITAQRRRMLAFIALAVLTYHIPFARDDTGAIAVERTLTNTTDAVSQRLESRGAEKRQPRTATLKAREKGRAVVSRAANRKTVTRKSARNAAQAVKQAAGAPKARSQPRQPVQVAS